MHRHEPIYAGRVSRWLAERIEPAQLSPVAQLRIESMAVTAADGPTAGVAGGGDPISFTEALASDFQPFEVGMPWGPPRGTTWFRLTATVPEPERHNLEAVVELGWADHSPGFQCEGLVYRPDGSIIKGLNPRNTWIPVELDAEGNLEVYLEAASNPILLDVPPFQPSERGDLETTDSEPLYTFSRAEVVRVHHEVRELVADITALDGLARVLPEDGARRAELRVMLDRALDAVDLDDIPATAAAARQILAGPLSQPAERSAHEVIAAGHAHIDSAWLWPLRETRRKVARTLANVLRLADDGEPIVFAFPAAQHAAWLQEDQPELFARVQQAVRDGVVVPVGGMWVESDANLPGGEALARQLVEGAAYFAETFDHRCEEVWLPDSFGYSAAFPQLARLAGAHWFLTQKISWNQVDDFPHHSFDWEGIDGSRIFTHFPPADTYNSDLSAKEMHHAATNFRDKGATGVSLVPFGYGDGGGGPTREMIAQARRTGDLEGSPKVRIGSPREFFEQAQAQYPDPPVWVGELYLELHRATFTTQARIKRANRAGEHLLREAELWAATAAVRLGRPYPAELFTQCWRTVLLGQFHDILPGTSISWVYREVLADAERVSDLLHAEIASAQGALAGDGDDAIAFNAGPFDRGGAPALGAGPVNAEGSVSAGEGDDGWYLESDALRVVLDRDGLVSSLTDKRADGGAGREVIPPGQRGNLLQVHQDFPNMWDAWDVDPFYRNTVQDIAGLDRVEVSVDDTSASVTVHRSYNALPIAQTLMLRTGEPGLHIDVDVQWASKDRFLKLAWPVDVHTDEARYEVQMGHLKRPTHTNTSWDFYRFEVYAHRWLHVGEPGYGVALANEATYGYDLTRHARDGGGTYHLVRASLLRGPAYPDPRTDHGRHTFGFALHPGADVPGAVAAGYASNLPLRTVTGSAVEPLVRLGPGAAVEAVKLARDGSGDVIVRLYEPAGRRALTTITPSFEVTGIVETCGTLGAWPGWAGAAATVPSRDAAAGGGAMKVGVNYTPRQGWFHSWLDFDVEAVKADLEAIASLGLDHVRIFPLWPVLQPDRALIRQAALDDVARVVAAAGDAGLDVHIDALNGHLSSFDYLPAWVTSWHRNNLFTEPDVIGAQAELVTALAQRVRDLPAAKGLGLGNEFSQFAAPRHPDVLPVTSAQVDVWLRTLLGAATEAWPQGRHTHSFDDDLWFTDAHPFGPRHAVEYGSSTTVHSWVFGKDWGDRAGDLDTYAWFARYLLELAAAHTSDQDRGLWLQEVGAPSSHVPASHAPQFLTDTLLRCADMPGLQAVTWWCSHDVSPALADFPELEYTLGLFDTDGEVKPLGRALAEVVPELRRATGATERPEVRFGADRRSDALPAGATFTQWLARAADGAAPALVRAPQT